MKCFIELWKAKDTWRALSKEERGEYLNQIGPHIQKLVEDGAEILDWGVNDSSTTYRADYDFFAVWKFPTKEAVSGFEAIVEGAGWYNYFEQINVSGEATTPDEVIEKMIAL